MTSLKQKITAQVCYTALVYNRINKKLGLHCTNEQIEVTNLTLPLSIQRSLHCTNEQIEGLIADILKKTDEKFIARKGKNFYISNTARNIRLTINSNTFRVITADKLRK